METTVSKRLVFFIVIATVLLNCVPVLAVDFKGDVIFSEAGRSSTGKIYVKGSRYRIEHKEEGQDVVILVDRDTGITHVLLPARKVYLEVQNTDPRSLMNNPFESIKYTKTRIKPKKNGTEKINGYTCDRYVFVKNGNKLITEWFSPSLGFPVKMVNHSSNSSVEIKNIEKSALNDSLFEVPAGYSAVQSPESQKAQAAKPGQRAEKISKQPGGSGTIKHQEFMLKGEGRETDVSSIEKTVNPGKNLVITIKANSPIRPVSKGKFSLYREGYKKVQEIRFALKNSESKTWELPAEKRVKHVVFGIFGTGSIKVSIAQKDTGATQKSSPLQPVKQEAVTASSAGTVPFTSFSSLLRDAEKLYSTGNFTDAVLHLRKAILSIWNNIPLTVINPVLVQDTDTYTPKPDNVYEPDEPIHIHCQVLGYTLKRVGHTYSVGLTADFVVMAEDGTVLGGKDNVLTLEKSTPMPNTEFLIDLTYTISGLKKGSYTIKTTIHDKYSSKSTTLMTPIRIKE